MTLKTVTVTGQIYNPDGTPAAGVEGYATLNRPETDNGIVIPTSTFIKADEGGQFSIQLWPNARGSGQSQYIVKAYTRRASVLNLVIMVPDVDVPVVITDIAIAQPYPPIDQSLQALLDVQAAAVIARAAKVEALAAEAGALASAQSAAGSATSAGQSAQNAQQSAIEAADSADSVQIKEQEREQIFEDAQEERENSFSASQIDKQNRFNDFIASSGYQFLGDYAAGIEITEYNQIVRDSDGEFWRLSGQVELPYTTTGAGMPEGGAFVSVGDALLRQELAAENSSSLIAGVAASQLAAGNSHMTDLGVARIPPNQEYVQPITANRPYPLGVAYGKAVGRVGNQMYVSADGISWSAAKILPALSSQEYAMAIWPTGDGEIIINRNYSLWKSRGWQSNPLTATYTRQLNVTTFSGSNYQFAAWSVDVRGDLIVAADYGSPKGTNHYVYLSTDRGETFAPVFSLADQVAADPGYNNAHIHGACIDPYADNRLWVVNGDNPAVSFWYSDDLGVTWKKFNNTVPSYETTGAQNVTPIYAMKNGIVCGTDGSPNGITLIPRGNPAEVKARQIFEFRDGTNATDVARQMWESESGVVYCAFAAAYGSLPSKIVAITPQMSVHEIWFDEAFVAVGDGLLINTAIEFKGLLMAGAGSGVLVAPLRRGQSESFRSADTGRILSGDAGRDPRNIAIGPTARILGRRSMGGGVGATSDLLAESAVVFGENARANNAAGAPTLGQVVIGLSAESSASDSVVIGREAKGGGSGSVQVGRSAETGGTRAVAIGHGAKTGRELNTAVGSLAFAGVLGSSAFGHNSSAELDRSTAIGHAAKATSPRSIAVGAEAIASTNDSVALGNGTATTLPFQCHIGERVLSMRNRPNPGSSAGEGSIYFKEVDGVQQLCVRFANGVIKVIADHSA